MKKKLLSLLIISGLFANSGGPGQGYAHNAPNMNNCTQFILDQLTAAMALLRLPIYRNRISLDKRTL